MIRRHPRACFVTGTDTGVGKTLVTAALARCLARSGRRIAVMKPVETGCSDAERSRSDGARLQAAAGTADPLYLVSPYRFEAPLAPLSAAAREKGSIDPDTIARALMTLGRERELVLVEGVGGVLVPLASGLDVRDLMVQLDVPVVVVGRAALGGVNHARLTLEALSSSGVRVVALVLNQTMPARPGIETEQERSTCDVLHALAPVPVLGPLPHFDAAVEAWDRAVDRAAAEPTITRLAELLRSIDQ